LYYNLKVQSPLIQNQDQESNRTSVTGSAIVQPNLIPNKGDMFAADVGDGREGVFRVTSTEKKSFLKDAVFVIEYILEYYSDDKVSYRDDLSSKIIKTLHFLQDFISHGQNALLTEEDNFAVEELNNKFTELVGFYFSNFYSKEYQTLILPGQTITVYDSYLANAVLSILSTRDAPEIRYIRKFNVSGDNYIKQPQFWDALINRDKSVLDNCNVLMGICSTKLFLNDPMLETLTFTGIGGLIYPLHPDTTLNTGLTPLPKLADNTTIQNVPSRQGNLESILYASALGTITPKLNKVDFTKSYVLSPAFYNDGVGKSTLEIMVLNYLEKKANNPSELLGLVLTYKNWGGLEKFYYLPIVLILIRSIIRNI
jgi:hypothetical protein